MYIWYRRTQELGGDNNENLWKNVNFFIYTLSRVGATMRSAESDLDCVYALYRSRLIVNGSAMCCVWVGVVGVVYGVGWVKVEWEYHVIVKIYEGPMVQGWEVCKERTAAAVRWTEFERIEGNCCTARGETAVWSICDPLMSSLRLAGRRVFMHIIWLSAVTKLPPSTRPTSPLIDRRSSGRAF